MAPLLRIAHHVQYPVQKQRRPVSKQRLGQRRFLYLLKNVTAERFDVVLIPFLRKLITDKAETPPAETPATVVPVA